MKKALLILSVVAIMVSPLFMTPKAKANARWTVTVEGSNGCGHTALWEVTYELNMYAQIVEVSRRMIVDLHPCTF